MNEFLIYLAICALTLLLFAYWFGRQGQRTEKRWLLKKIQQGGEHQQAYLNALQELDKQNNNTAIITLIMALLIIPATLVIDYVWFQEIPISERVSISDVNQQAPDLETAIRQLEAKLADNPDDLEGQLLYGRSMMRLQQFDKAVAAYQLAVSLAPDNAGILTELAEAIAFRNNTGSFLGEPEALIRRALELQPAHQKAMWLQGIIYYEQQQYQPAEDIWTALLPAVTSPGVRNTITQQINQARAALDKPPLQSEPQPGDDNRPLYDVLVDASEDIQAMNIPDNARLFVFAREVDGPPMPVAAIPLNPPFDWPILVTLTDRNSLTPQRPLSGFTELSFSAKLSLSGSATPAADDVQSAAVINPKTNNTLTLTLEP